jgi:TRAP-type C4-dicarboxylate transport system substrate-binding protein
MAALQISTGNSLSSKELWQRIQNSQRTAITKALEISREKKIDLRESYIKFVVPELLKKH